MKKINIFASILLLLGILAYIFYASLYSMITGDGLGAGWGVIFISFPLILVSIILFIIGFFNRGKN